MQRNLNLTEDPVILRQQNNLLSQKKKKIQRLDKTLSSEDGEKLLNLWRENNFAEFNSWVQVAKAQVNTEVYETSNEMNRRLKKSFTCNLTLTFEEDPSLVMTSNGYANNKKDAKKMAIEKIVMELINNGEISRGLRGNNFLQGSNRPSDSYFQSPRFRRDNTDDTLQKKVHKLAKKMQESLKRDNFFEACDALCQISVRKRPDWNEVAFIWTYALLKKDFSYVKAVIDLVQYKRVQPTLSTSSLEETKINEEINRLGQDDIEEKAKQELMKKYGNYRLKSDNPYDLLDLFNVEVNLPEIDPAKNGKEVTEEEATAEIIKDPLAIDITKLLIKDSSEGFPLGDLNSMLNQLSNNGNNITNPLATFTDPKLLNFNSAIEINKLLHHLDFQQSPLKLLIQPLSQTSPKILEALANDLNNLMGQAQLLNQITSNQSGGNASGSKTENQITKVESTTASLASHIDLNTSREIKNPSINYLSFKLLNEFYDSLMYVGDMHFALSVAEVLYTRVKLDDEEFINNFASYYYANKKNMIMVEMIESIFQPIVRQKNRPTESICSVEGNVEKVGNKYSQEVLVFTPSENQEHVETKILKRGHNEGRDGYYQIGEGEFVKLALVSEKSQLLELFDISKIEEIFTMPIQFSQPSGINKQNTSENPDYCLLEPTELIACVREIQRDFKVKLFVMPTKEQAELLGQRGRTWRITKLTNRATVDKTSESLETFCTQITMAQPLLQILLSPPICNNNYVQQLAESKVLLPIKPHKTCVTNLNSSQQKALESATSQLLTLIQGPPGTGKTTTAVEIVLEWLRLSPSPILACADSNIAIDRLYEEFKAAGIRCMRIGPGYDDKNDFRTDKSYAMYTAYCNAKQYHNANAIRFGIIKRRLSEAQVICATCVGSTSEYLKGMTFPRVILDEVTQANELSTLIPLTKGCQQLVLIGDHKQLPPTVMSSFAQSKGMTISLFERLVKQGVQPNLLNIQYRMHSSIAEFPSYRFYDKMLENGTDDSDRPIVKGFNWPNESVRVALVNVKGEEQVYSSSIQNSKEVEVVVEILMQLLAFNDISTIGIITPYDAQKKRIRNEVNLQAKKYPHLFGFTEEEAQKISRNSIINDIDTVDGYQGMERELIIFSAVRSNRTGTLGFLRDPRRLNVTLTRAKRGLIIVGNMETLIYDQNWKEWVQWCKKNKVILHYK